MDANLIAAIALLTAAGASGLAAVLAAKLYAAREQLEDEREEIAGHKADRKGHLKTIARLSSENADLRAITPKRGSNGKFLPRANGAAKAKVAGAGTRV